MYCSMLCLDSRGVIGQIQRRHILDLKHGLHPGSDGCLVPVLFMTCSACGQVLEMPSLLLTPTGGAVRGVDHEVCWFDVSMNHVGCMNLLYSSERTEANSLHCG